MNHLMVDLETLDTRPSTVILSIGAVVFDEHGVHRDPAACLYRRCLWQAQINAGRTVSEATIRWWLKQSDAARAALDGVLYDLDYALAELATLYREGACERIWANGQSFDISILDHAYGGYKTPWKYSAPRDMRTLRDLVPPDLMADVEQGTAHDALADALYQAEFTVRALRYLAK